MKPWRIFGFYALPVVLLAALLALFAGLGARLGGGASVGALSLPDTLPSGIMVQPGAILGGQALRIGEAITNGTTPTIQRPVGSFAYTRDGTTAFMKTGTAIGAWTPVGTSGASSQTGAVDRAAALSGISTSLLTCLREDWGPTWTQQYVDALVGTGGITTNVVPSTDIGGLLQLTTGAGAASRARRHVGALMFGRPDTNRFYMATRAAFITTADIQTMAIVGTFDFAGTFTIGLGVCGATTATNFVVNYDAAGGACSGTRVPTNVVIDATQHLFEEWSQADGKIHFAIDLTEISGSPFTMVSPPTGSGRPMFDVQNNATGAARTWALDWYLACWQQT